MTMEALILTGGLGARLRSTVRDVPKVMAPVGGRPFLSYIIGQLSSQGISDICLGVGYLYESIMDYFKDGSGFGVNLSYSIEKHPLGTGGAVRKAATQLSNQFLILNGDSYLDIVFKDLIQFHRQTKGLITMAVTKVEEVGRYGSVELDHESRVTAFKEKAACARTTLINSGTYIIDKEILKDIPENIPVSFEKEILPRYVNKGFFGLKVQTFFIDIGTPTSYRLVRKGFPKEVLR